MLLSIPERNNKIFAAFIIIFVAFTGLLTTACSSKWKAPVHTYSTPSNQRPVQPAKSYPSRQPINGTYYKVRKGDTLYSIAWRTGRDYQNLASWNRLQRPYTIYVGQVLRTKPPVKKAAAPARKKTVRKTTAKPAVPPSVSKTEKFKQRLYWRWPASGKIIKGFRKGDDTRKGIVLSGKVGYSVTAAEEGKVVYSGSGLIGYGRLIIIKHNKNYLSAYGHNRKILVKEGDWVTKGKKIAEMGMNDKGIPALHFEIRKNGDPLNPIAVLPKRN